MAGIADRGLNVADMQGLITKLDAQCTSIQTIVSQIQSAMDATTWVGPDSTAFRGDWQAQLRPALTRVGEAIQHARVRANSNLQDQIATSSRG